MARIIKAPNVHQDRPYRIVERDKVLRHVDDEAAEILEGAHNQEEAILRDAAEQADGIIADAEQQVQEVMNQAQADADAVREQAKQEGFQQGQTQGLADAQKQVSGVVNDLKKMIAQGQSILQGMIQDQEEEIRKLVAEIVGRVIQLKIEADDEIVVRVAKECIRQAADRQNVRVLVHPDDKAKVEEWAPEFSRMFDDIERITIDADPRVQKGGVIVESGAGGIDGRIDKQVEILNNTVLNP